MLVEGARWILQRQLRSDITRPDFVHLLIAFVASTLAFCIGSYNVYQHLLHYEKPILQRNITRILAITPIYSVFSCISLMIPSYLLLCDTVRDLWEAVVIYCFLSLIIDYCGGEAACLNAIQHNPGYVSHVFPVCLISNTEWGSRYVRHQMALNGFFLRLCKQMTLQFIVIKPLMAMTTISLFTHAPNVMTSWAWRLFEGVTYNFSYSVALYGLALFYFATREHPDLKQTHPLRKFISVKLVVFATYWQYLLVTILLRQNDMETIKGWNSWLICVELPLNGLLQAFAFPVSEFMNDKKEESIEMASRAEAAASELNREDLKMEAPTGLSPETVAPSVMMQETTDDHLMMDPTNREANTSPRAIVADTQNTDSLRQSPPSSGGILNALSAPLKRRLREVQDADNRDIAFENVKHVVNFQDVVTDAIYSFRSRYSKHAPVPSQDDDNNDETHIEVHQ